jgi:hypothetical protein
MSEIQDSMADGAMRLLLAMGRPIDIGIPAWLLREIVTRKAYPVKPRDALGLSKVSCGKSLVDEYLATKGYEFSWGTLSESVGQSEFDGSLVGTFEVFPKHVLQAFPQSKMLEDLFSWMYRHHPLQHDDYYPDESNGAWFVMSFSSYSEKGIVALRQWLTNTFLPRILPDLIAEAMRIVEEAKRVAIARSIDGSFEEALVERERFQLCGYPTELSFYNERDNLN